jgi:hypothetical protein
MTLNAQQSGIIDYNFHIAGYSCFSLRQARHAPRGLLKDAEEYFKLNKYCSIEHNKLVYIRPIVQQSSYDTKDLFKIALPSATTTQSTNLTNIFK